MSWTDLDTPPPGTGRTPRALWERQRMVVRGAPGSKQQGRTPPGISTPCPQKVFKDQKKKLRPWGKNLRNIRRGEE